MTDLQSVRAKTLSDLQSYRAEPAVDYRTVSSIEYYTLILENLKFPKCAENINISLENGTVKHGKVLEISGNKAVILVFEGTHDISPSGARCEFTGSPMKIPLSEEMLGRVLSGSGQPIDNGPPVLAEETADIQGQPINPCKRICPNEMIQTGISAIDLTSSVVRGQKIPLFSCAGLPHNEIAAQICRQSKLVQSKGVLDLSHDNFCFVFAGLGASFATARFFVSEFEESGAMDRTVLFMNYAQDPMIERIITPRLALTTAEYLAYERELHVLVVMTDMLQYPDALRAISESRRQVPCRRGFPSYMLNDLSSLFERAGVVDGKNGSITQIPILSMPHDDVTHPVPDLTGFLTDGQIFLDRSLHNRRIYPPINVLSSSSMLMKNAVATGVTREDHAVVSEQLLANYAVGKDTQGLRSVVGEEALGVDDFLYLEFVEKFENKLLSQEFRENRSLDESLDMSWSLLRDFPVEKLKKISDDKIKKLYYHRDHLRKSKNAKIKYKN